jgi:hypothetical protein
MAKYPARVWPAGASRRGALVQLPAPAAQAGDLAVVWIEVAPPRGESDLRSLVFARRRIIGKGSGGLRRVCPRGAAWDGSPERFGGRRAALRGS